MTRFPAVDCALEGFRLTRERPAAIAVWGVLFLLSSLAPTALMVGSGLAAPLGAMQAAVQGGDLGAVNVQSVEFGRHAPAVALSFVAGVLLHVMLYTALLRAIIRPQDQGRTFYLRLGADEMRQLAVSALLALAVFGALIVASLVATLAMGSAASAGPAASGAVAGATLLVAAILMIYPGVRLSLAGPMSFDARKIIVRPAWGLSRGHVGGMIGAYLLALVMAMVVYFLLLIIVGAIVFATLKMNGQGWSDMHGWLAADVSSLSTLFAAKSLTALVCTAIVDTLVFTITLSPAAAIYLALRGLQPTPR